MYRLILIFLISFFVINSSQAGNDKLKIKKGTFEKVKAYAQKKNKIIFIDFYADWCGPCKKMDKEVLNNPEVVSFFNDNFINYKINADDELALIPKIDYQITSLPTYVWIMPNGEMLHFYKGTCTPGIFMMQAKKAISLKQ